MSAPDRDVGARRPGRPSLLRRVISLARPEIRLLALGTVFLVIGSAANLAMPQAIRRILDGVLGAGDRARIDRTALWMAVIFLVQGIAFGLRFATFTIAGERTVTRLRELVYRRIIAQEIAFFDERRTGELTNRLGSDTTVLQNSVSSNLSMGLRHGAAVIGGIALLAYTSPTLTLVMLAVVPPMAVGAMIYGRKVRSLSRGVQDALAGANEIAEESIAGIRTVRTFAAEQAEMKRYGVALDRSFEVARTRAKATGTFIGGASVAGYGGVALVLWYGGRLVLAGEMTVGGLTSFILYTLLVAFALGGLGELWTDFMKAVGAAERVFSLLDRIPAIPTSGGLRPHAAAGKLELRAVEFAYPARPDVSVLRGLDLTIEAGEVIALVGASGAGKSTIGSLIARLYDPDAGALLLDGHDLRDLDPAWLRAQIAVVAQEPVLFSSSIADNIRYGKTTATDEEVALAARAANAHDFIQAFPGGYTTLVGERGAQLSGGQKQRVAIARAVLKDPRVLILDEATSALDAESEHLVQEALERLMKGRTTLIIAHRLSTVMNAHRVLVIEAGRVIEAGSHAELMGSGGMYRRLVERQFVALRAAEMAPMFEGRGRGDSVVEG